MSKFKKVEISTDKTEYIDEKTEQFKKMLIEYAESDNEVVRRTLRRKIHSVTDGVLRKIHDPLFRTIKRPDEMERKSVKDILKKKHREAQEQIEYITTDGDDYYD